MGILADSDAVAVETTDLALQVVLAVGSWTRRSNGFRACVMPRLSNARIGA